MPDATTVALIAGLMGLLFGSFLNVCTLRWPKNESVVRPPSHCGSCGARIRWFDNIPVLSWLWLRYQPNSGLAQWFGRRFGGGGKRMRRIGIVALARRLLIALWRYVNDGVIPEGAILRAA